MNSARTYDAVVAGYIAVDLTPDFSAFPEGTDLAGILRPGSLVEAGELAISPGGAVSNTGIALRKFGNSVRLNGLVGNDPLGDAAIGIYESHGLADGVSRRSDAGTGYCIVLSPPGVDRAFLENPGCNAVFASEHVDYDAVAQCRLFHFGYPPLSWKRCTGTTGKSW